MHKLLVFSLAPLLISNSQAAIFSGDELDAWEESTFEANNLEKQIPFGKIEIISPDEHIVASGLLLSKPDNSATTVLTCGHILQAKDALTNPKTKFHFIRGSSNVSIPIIEYIQHPDISCSLGNDLGILYLNKPVENIPPTEFLEKLPPEDSEIALFSVGYGMTMRHNDPLKKLEYSKLPTYMQASFQMNGEVFTRSYQSTRLIMLEQNVYGKSMSKFSFIFNPEKNVPGLVQPFQGDSGSIWFYRLNNGIFCTALTIGQGIKYEGGIDTILPVEKRIKKETEEVYFGEKETCKTILTSYESSKISFDFLLAPLSPHKKWIEKNIR